MKLYTFDSKTLKYKSFNVKGGLMRITILSVLIFSLLGISQPRIKIEEISKLNFKYPHIVLAQAILETGNYESKIFKENNNLFGMKEARVRLNLAKGTQHGHAYYDDWKESLTDYALWYSTYASKCKNEKQLYKLLNKQYAEAKYYPQALQRIIKRDQLESKFKK
jgi:uncharacterized FlgJ-related protein